MPLRDHFNPPLNEIASWDELHGGWPMVIVQQLGDKLPDNYVAAPRVHLGTEAEIDVVAFEQEDLRRRPVASEQGGLATAVWAPAEPTFAVETDLADVDEYEVRIYDVRRGRRLVAAVEIISPANKDRAKNRNQFTAKCAALLRQGVSLVVVDLVTVRSFNLYFELMELIGERDPSLGDPPPATYAAACRWRSRERGRWLEVWNHPLAIGSPLPCPPLWLSEELAVPLDLEASYEKTCRDLRIQ
jgi:hypothetical protein